MLFLGSVYIYIIYIYIIRKYIESEIHLVSVLLQYVFTLHVFCCDMLWTDTDVKTKNALGYRSP